MATATSTTSRPNNVSDLALKAGRCFILYAGPWIRRKFSHNKLSRPYNFLSCNCSQKYVANCIQWFKYRFQIFQFDCLQLPLPDSVKGFCEVTRTDYKFTIRRCENILILRRQCETAINRTLLCQCRCWPNAPNFIDWRRAALPAGARRRRRRDHPPRRTLLIGSNERRLSISSSIQLINRPSIHLYEISFYALQNDGCSIDIVSSALTVL